MPFFDAWMLSPQCVANDGGHQMHGLCAERHAAPMQFQLQDIPWNAACLLQVLVSEVSCIHTSMRLLSCMSKTHA